MTTLRTTLAGLLVIPLLLGACGGKAPREEAAAPGGPSVLEGSAGVRAIELDYGGLDAARLERLEAYGAQDMLRENLEALLRKQGQLDPSGDLDVVVSLASFRLRSSASAFWLGALAGADSVEAEVHVMRGGKEVRRFETNTSSILGGIAYASATKRSRRLMSTLAQRIVDRL